MHIQPRDKERSEYVEHGGMTKYPLPRDKEINGGLSRKTKHEVRQMGIQPGDKERFEYGDHGQRTKHPLARAKEMNGGLSMETKHEVGQMHIPSRDKGGSSTVNMEGGQSAHSLETRTQREV